MSIRDKLAAVDTIARELATDRTIIRDRSAAMRDARSIARENAELLDRIREQMGVAENGLAGLR